MPDTSTITPHIRYTLNYPYLSQGEHMQGRDGAQFERTQTTRWMLRTRVH